MKRENSMSFQWKSLFVFLVDAHDEKSAEFSDRFKLKETRGKNFWKTILEDSSEILNSNVTEKHQRKEIRAICFSSVIWGGIAARGKKVNSKACENVDNFWGLWDWEHKGDGLGKKWMIDSCALVLWILEQSLSFVRTIFIHILLGCVLNLSYNFGFLWQF